MVAAILTRPRPSKYNVQLAHCGDSRAVLSVGQRLVCSQDHKPNRPDETDRIRAAGGSVEHGPLGGPLRVDGALAVSRAMGDFHFKPAGMDPSLCKVTALPEVQTVEGCGDGDWLLLACDGVFDVFENEEVYEFVSSRIRQAAPQPADGGQIMVELLKACLDKGSKDNCTALLVQFGVGGGAKPHSRELLQGLWARSPREVQAKYAEFFAAHGFEAEARALWTTTGRPLASSSSSEGPQQAPVVAGAGVPPPSGQRQLAALAKALQAMRSTRVIQGAWRARRGSGVGADASAADGSVGSIADFSSGGGSGSGR